MNSDRIMARLTLIGITVAVATLLVTMAIINGFGDTYERALLNFNAHITVSRDHEFTEQERVALDTLVAAARVVPVARTIFSAEQLAAMTSWWTWGIDRYYRCLDATLGWPILPRLLAKLDPVPHVDGLLETDWIPHRLLDTFYDSTAAASRGVVASTPFLYREGLLVGEGKIHGVVVKGIEPVSVGHVNPLRFTIPNHSDLAKALQPPAAREPIPLLVGIGFGYAPGTELKLFLPRGDDTATTNPRNFIRANVVGTFESGLHDYDSQFVLVDLAVLQSLYHLASRITGIELRLDDPAKAPWVAALLERRTEMALTILPWQEMHRPILEAVALERILFALIMGILVAVAAFNILATVLLRCLRQHRSIAILRTIGLSVRRARRRYFWWGFRTGAVGVAAGLAIGSGIAMGVSRYEWITIPPEVYFLSRLPISLSLTMLTSVACFGLLLCAAAASHAARKVTELPLLAALGRQYH